MNLTLVLADSDDVFPLEVEATDPVSKLKETAEAVSGKSQAEMDLVVNGGLVRASGTMKDAGISEGDMIMVQPKQQPQRQQQSTAGQQAPQMQVNADGSFMYPEQVIELLRSRPQGLTQLRQTNPDLCRAVENGDVSALQQLMRQQHMASQLPADPLDPEYQRRLMEHMQQQAIDESYANAMEHTPEVFAAVDMLYVDMTANGEPLKVFVDSGAQMTIMTGACAEKCNLMRLVDKRFQGMAVGVGSSKILGRIHTCSLKVGDQYIATSITVLEQKTGPQCIFGLDNMRRHQCQIDLKDNVLRILSCGVELPFIPQHLVSDSFNVERQVSAEQMDDSADIKASGNKVASGDTSLLRSGSSPTAKAAPPAAGGAADGAGTSAAATGAGSGAPAAPNAPAPAGGSEMEAKVQQLQQVTGESADKCRAALQAAGGNAEIAASHLLGFS